MRKDKVIIKEINKTKEKRNNVITLITVSALILAVIISVIYLDAKSKQDYINDLNKLYEADDIIIDEEHFAQMTDELNINYDKYLDKTIHIAGRVDYPKKVTSLNEYDPNVEILNNMVYVGRIHYWQDFNEYNNPGINVRLLKDNNMQDVIDTHDVLKQDTWIEAEGKLKMLKCNNKEYVYLEIIKYKVYENDPRISNIVVK